VYNVLCMLHVRLASQPTIIFVVPFKNRLDTPGLDDYFCSMKLYFQRVLRLRNVGPLNLCCQCLLLRTALQKGYVLELS